MSIFSNIDFVTILKPLVVAAGGWLVSKVSKWFTAKTGVEVDKRLTSVLDMAIDKAEEWARKSEKDLRGTVSGVLEDGKRVVQGKISSNDKLKHAVEFATAELRRRGLPKIAAKVLAELVESRVQALRKSVNAALK